MTLVLILPALTSRAVPECAPQPGTPVGRRPVRRSGMLGNQGLQALYVVVVNSNDK